MSETGSLEGSEEGTSQQLAEKRTGFAEDRTDWAEDRTAMANERTFAGWMRTAFAAIGIGIGFNALFERLEPSWVPRLIASAFILIGAVVMYLAQKRASHAFERLSAHAVDLPPVPRLRIISWSVIIGAFALVAAFWLLDASAPS